MDRGTIVLQSEKPAAKIEEVQNMNDPRVEAVKEHALLPENYNAGWDVVVETMVDSNIYAVVKKTRTAKGAIKKMAALVDDINDYRNEVVNA